MMGPALLLVAGVAVGGMTAQWTGAVAGALVALVVTLGVAGAAAWWAGTVGRTLERATAWQVAPRPPLFRGLCDAVYRRALGSPGDEADDKKDA